MTDTINQPFPWPGNLDGYSGVDAAVVALQPTTGTAQTGYINISGSVTAAGGQAVTGSTVSTKTSAATALSTTVASEGALTLSATGIVSGNGWGTAGLTTMSGTVTGGAFIFGAYGKLILSGTQNHADSRMAALFAKVDASGGTYTAGQLSAAWFDMGSTSPSGGWATGAQANVIRVQNTTSDPVNALIYGYGKATFAMDLSDNAGGWAFASGAADTAAGGITISVNGDTRYINLWSGIGTLA